MKASTYLFFKNRYKIEKPAGSTGGRGELGLR